MIRFDTRDYVNSHGHTPRGRGGWIFAPKGFEDNQGEWINMGSRTYSDARDTLRRVITKVLSDPEKLAKVAMNATVTEGHTVTTEDIRRRYSTMVVMP